MLQSAIFNTSELCYQLGVRHAVMSPGSRNAPLTISFARNEKIEKWIVPDERSAGFIALGIAQQLNQPVVLCCTSGTALLNYAPAIAEAYYREIPLIVLSADRPPHLIDQRDGQTIRQFEVLKNHVKLTLQLPLVNSSDDDHHYYEPIIQGVQESLSLPKGPVHLNIPFEEPFYPNQDQVLAYASKEVFGNITPPIIPKVEPSQHNISAYKKVLILVGQQPQDSRLSKELELWKDKCVIIVSPLNNLTCAGVSHVDLFIKDDPKFQPDLLITSGLSVLSKKLKQFIRKSPPTTHWHFDVGGVEVDTYNSSPELISLLLADYLQGQEVTSIDPDKAFVDYWKNADDNAGRLLQEFEQTAAYSEAKVMSQLLQSIPKDTILHLGNSMPVRYADIFGVKKGIPTWCNRGTSGIDGISSTVVGSSLVSDQLHVLITGDISFLYDRNAFFHNYKLPNLRIIVINNQGGGIFRLIDGPKNQPELEEYFETRHKRTAEWVCMENGFHYWTVHTTQELREQLVTFYRTSEHAILMEVFVDPKNNEIDYKALRGLFN